jgi:uncharacterized protein (TIGR03435 family)
VKRHKRLLVFAGALLELSAVVTGQERPPKFDVASVKPGDPNRPSTPLRIGHGSLTVKDRVIGLITLAFNLDRQLVEGGPAWIETEWWEVAAKGETSAGPDQIKLMLQSLLADRFQFKFHSESKTVSGYSLIVDPKRGMLAKESAPDTSRDGRGSIQVDSSGFRAHGTSMTLLCKFLASGAVLRGPVVDNTGLTGIYDFRLTYDDPSVPAASTEPGQYGDIFGAVQTIGLKLTSAKVPITVLHIDNVERPSGN